MDRIRITNYDGDFIFTSGMFAPDSEGLFCEKCGEVPISSRYVYIIDNLREKGLLSKDYKKECCFCRSIQGVDEIIIYIDDSNSTLVLLSGDKKFKIPLFEEDYNRFIDRYDKKVVINNPTSEDLGKLFKTIKRHEEENI